MKLTTTTEPVVELKKKILHLCQQYLPISKSAKRQGFGFNGTAETSSEIKLLTQTDPNGRVSKNNDDEASNLTYLDEDRDERPISVLVKMIRESSLKLCNRTNKNSKRQGFGFNGTAETSSEIKLLTQTDPNGRVSKNNDDEASNLTYLDEDRDERPISVLVKMIRESSLKLCNRTNKNSKRQGFGFDGSDEISSEIKLLTQD